MQVRKNILRLILSASIVLFANNVFAAETSFAEPQNGEAKSKIIASFYEGSSQKELIAGFEIELGEGWTIYAPDDSGFGIAPSFDFSDSKNINISKTSTHFPKSYTKKENIGDIFIEYQVYKGKVIIPFELEVIDAKKETQLEINVSYGLCKGICIPASQSFSLSIPASQIDNDSLEKIQKFLPNKKVFNPDQIVKKTTKDSQKISIFKALIIAFIGGVILNIMPCVLPVLSIKLLSVINHSQSKTSKIRFAFFSTILGIVFSFAIFAVVAVILKSLGSAVGWGFQFQNPYFLIFLITVLIIFVANLLDLFEFNFGSSLGSVLNNEISKKEKNRSVFIPNFFSGILAVLLATPCSAPFVGVAVSFALGSDVKEIFLIFGSMSLGLSLPYLFLIAFPKSVKLMPKPGAWMLKIKQLMAGFLLATVAWLIYVLIDNIGLIAAASAAILALLILLFFKIVHKSHLKNQEKSFSKKQIATIVIVFSFLVSSIFIIPNCLAYLDDMMEKSQAQYWIKFEESEIQGLVDEGKVVVVDITADWCITCKVNKLLVLDTDVIKDQLKKPNIIAMRGDLTKPDEDIFNFMRKYNRYGIPFNLVFGPNAPKGILISELTSKDELLGAIKQASQQ
ncbi:MAG: suppressor for copper-sensitivity B [Myxococcota bacterium]|jgi:suppressor for copper-sensitivity B